MSAPDVVIVSAKRTPIGAFLGALSPLTAVQLGSAAAQGAVQAAGVAPEDIQEVIMGCVLPANLGQAPARQAALGAGIPQSVPATTINKMCGSGLKAVMMAAEQIRSGTAEVILAGGLESMSNAPYLLAKARSGYRMGSGEVIDHMLRDGLQSPFDGKSMGCFADATAARYNFTRAQQDAFATESVRRAQAAVASGAFAGEIVAVKVATRKGEVEVATDEQPGKCDIAKIPTLKPAFRKENGTVTAASSSSISDGAAATVLMSADAAKKRGVKPLARVVAHATHAQEPEWFTTAPVGAIRKVLDKAGWKVADVDLFEVNEAFAVVAMAPMKELGIAHEKLNIHGGATALGHPIGASGARLVVTLMHALKQGGGRRGVAALCIGGGEATAIALELA